MPQTASIDELRHAVTIGNAATSPEQAREALAAIGDILGGTDNRKLRQAAQSLGDDGVMKVCKDTVKSLEKKAGLGKPWWKVW